ncbi:uncharacterized protein [Ptychodera flava]|uniref:uncharacterized protein n=1 Tax=Ptychodera flava TaxID=63121 RepID=UPI003969FE6D
MASHHVMKYFNPELRTELIVDGSPTGLGAILAQKTPEDTHIIIAYARRTLSDTESRYRIFNKPLCRSTARIERLCLRLQPYKFEVKYRPGKDNPADYMSRHPQIDRMKSKSHISRIDAHANFITENAVPNAMTLEEVQKATEQDTTLQELSQVVMTQRWFDVKPDVRPYKVVKDELSISNGVLLRGNRLIISHKLQRKAVQLAHSGHQGIVKTKSC